jgi:hypothetical protein
MTAGRGIADPQVLEQGALNLLGAAGPLPARARVLICHEPAEAGYYAPELTAAIAGAAERAGHHPVLREVPFRPLATTLPDGLATAMARADLTVFVARIGDQMRFAEMPEGSRAVITYALDPEALASTFGTLPHRDLVALKAALDSHLAAARDIRVTCPAGSAFSGRPGPPETAAEVGLARFPMSVMRPIRADGFSGRVALPGFLLGTGSRYYAPYRVDFDGPLAATFEAGRLTGFEGAASDRARAEAHYDHVAALFGIDRDAVHSWHAGIHPGCAFPGDARTDPVRWGGSAFGNPRILHFHTCGAYPPGEICWNVLDATVTVDGVALWQGGRFQPAALPGAAEILDRAPALARAFANPARAVGL